jgi:flagellar capping protein FliD
MTPMNPLIVTIIIALATFIISIFGANWLNQQMMNRRFDDLNKRFDDLNKRIDDLRGYIDARFTGQETRFAAIEQRLDRIDRQLEAIFKPSLPTR